MISVSAKHHKPACKWIRCLSAFFTWLVLIAVAVQDVYEPVMHRIIPYMFCIGLVGIFMLVVLRKKFIIDYRLHFPSGTATGILISGFHTPKGEAQAKEQASCSALAPILPSHLSLQQLVAKGGVPNPPYRLYLPLGTTSTRIPSAACPELRCVVCR